MGKGKGSKKDKGADAHNKPQNKSQQEASSGQGRAMTTRSRSGMKKVAHFLHKLMRNYLENDMWFTARICWRGWYANGFMCEWNTPIGTGCHPSARPNASFRYHLLWYFLEDCGRYFDQEDFLLSMSNVKILAALCLIFWALQYMLHAGTLLLSCHLVFSRLASV